MRTRLALVVLALTGAMGTPARAGDLGIPSGFQTIGRSTLAPGVEHVTLRRPATPLLIHVARIAVGADVSLRAVLSNSAVAETGDRLERTSAMCTRVHCIAAVNAEFAVPGTDEPVGGFITGGVLQRSPASIHHQLTIGPDGHLAAGPLSWSGKLAALDLTDVTVTGVNVDRADDALVAYTSAWGPSTLTNKFGVELVGHVVGPNPVGVLGATSVVELDAIHDGEGNAAIAPDGVVFSGHGRAADALRAFWHRIEGEGDHRALLRFDTGTPAVESVGGTPVLLKDGKRWFGNDSGDFVQGRHPRTIIGWNASGDTLLVTVDGRQPGTSEGVTLAEAADLMTGLGATDAINLDGGGSTTFVVGGQIANQPSDTAVRHHGQNKIVHQAGPGDVVVGRVERPVVAALAIVANSPLARPAADPLAHVDLQRPQAIRLAVSYAGDPASMPGAKLPGLIDRRSPEPGRSLLAVALSANLVVALGLALAGRFRRVGRVSRCAS